MKKFILIFSFIISFVFVNAQTVTFPPLTADNTYFINTTNYTLTNTTARNFIIPAAQHWATTQDYIVKIDSTGGDHTNVSVSLWGQKSAIAGDWVQIGSTVNWKGTTADTVIIISNTTANRFRNYKATIVGTGTGTSKISVQELKLYR